MAAKTFALNIGREYLLHFCSYLGFHVFLQDGKKNILYYLCYWLLDIAVAFCIYTIYILRNDPITILKCLCLCGSACQCSIKVHLAHLHREKFQKSFDFIKLKHQASEDDPEINEIFWKSNKIYYFLQKMILYGYNFSLFIMLSYPLLSFTLYGEKKFFMICNIPGLNPDPEAGFPDYEIQFAFHLTAFIVGTNQMVAFDGILTYFILNGASVADTLIIHIRRMSSLQSQNSLSVFDTKEWIRHLSFLHQEYIEYIERLDNMYSPMFIMQFTSFAQSASLGLYAARVSDWYVVYYIVMCNVFQLFFFCALGSIIESKNSEIFDELYKSNWIDMSVKNRRMLLFMMHRARTQKSMMVGSIKKLNLETGMDIYKTLYSYSILLKDTVKV